MQNVNLHMQRIVSIIIGVLGLIFCFLPWVKEGEGYGSVSHMGFSIWGGIVSALAIAGVIVNCLLIGDRTKPFDKQGRIIAMICFAVMFLLAILVLVGSGTEQTRLNDYYVLEVKKSAGIGVWLTLVISLAGLALSSGLLNAAFAAKSTMAGPSTTAPPPAATTTPAPTPPPTSNPNPPTTPKT